MFHEFILCIVKNLTDRFWRHLVASFYLRAANSQIYITFLLFTVRV